MAEFFAWLGQLTGFDPLSWRNPAWLWLLAVPVLSLLWRRLRQQRQYRRYAEASLLPWLLHRDTKRVWRHWRGMALTLSWALLCIALAGPRQALEVLGKAGVPRNEIILAIDLSRSMDAADVVPSRRQRAIIEAHELVRLLQRRFATTHADSHTAPRTSAGNIGSLGMAPRLGLVVFAGRAHLLLPPTADYAVVSFYLDTLNTLQLPTRGSALRAALATAAGGFDPRVARHAIIVLSDGDTGSPSTSARSPDTALLAQARSLAREQIHIATLGIGSAAGTGLPLSGGGWLRDADGQAVVTRLHATRLAALARAGGGHYSPQEDDDSDWRKLYEPGTVGITGAGASDRQVIWREDFPWFLFPALLLFFIATLPYLPVLPAVARRRDTASRTDGQAATTPHAGGHLNVWLPWAGVLLLAGSLLTPAPAQAGERDAWAAYRAQQYATARALYSRERGYRARLGEGDSLYRLGRYADALRQFTLAVQAATTDAERASALFNLGNSHFQLGDYGRAASVFRDVLRYRAGFAAARHNLQLSAALQARVAERARAVGLARRMGSGPRTAVAPPGMDVDSRGRLAIGDATPNKPPDDKADTLATLTPPQVDALVRLGLERTRLAGARTDTSTSSTGSPPASARRAEAALQQADETGDDRGSADDTAAQTARLWKRIFEEEEGFPAPLARPHTLPGEAPW